MATGNYTFTGTQTINKNLTIIGGSLFPLDSSLVNTNPNFPVLSIVGAVDVVLRYFSIYIDSTGSTPSFDYISVVNASKLALDTMDVRFIKQDAGALTLSVTNTAIFSIKKSFIGVRCTRFVRSSGAGWLTQFRRTRRLESLGLESNLLTFPIQHLTKHMVWSILHFR
jgi:hypothetical protein